MTQKILKPMHKASLFLQTFGPKNNGRFITTLNEYETAPYFLQLSQNMTSNCLFTFVFFPVLTCFAQKIVFLVFRTIFGAKQVNSGKNGEKLKSKQTISCNVLA
jgi:hypothetical protein